MKNFIERWKNYGYEKGESQKFWIELLKKIIPTFAGIFLLIWKIFLQVVAFQFDDLDIFSFNFHYRINIFTRFITNKFKSANI